MRIFPFELGVSLKLKVAESSDFHPSEKSLKSLYQISFEQEQKTIDVIKNKIY